MRKMVMGRGKPAKWPLFQLGQIKCILNETSPRSTRPLVQRVKVSHTGSHYRNDTLTVLYIKSIYFRERKCNIRVVFWF